MHLRLVLIALLFTQQHSIAQVLDIPYKVAEVNVDGLLNEDIWDDLPVHTNFHNYQPSDEGLAEEQTEVKLFHDGEHIYVASTYFDYTNSRVGSLKRDDTGNSIGQSDGFVMIFDSQNSEQSAFYFAVNARNTQMDALVERRGDSYDLNRSWSTIWNSAVSEQDNTVYYEVKIPLQALSYSSSQSTWGVQFYSRNIKKPNWSIFADVSQNFRLFDLRFTQDFTIANLSQSNPNRLTASPSLTSSMQKDILNNRQDESLIPSLDLQYSLTSSLKLDATINPDFSQVEVDQQVTNLSRFAINFPERRKFFIENSDLFTNLGDYFTNPFHSRTIGASEDILGGLKLSGNVAKSSKIGILSVQTKEGEDDVSNNYTTIVGQQDILDNISATGYLVNRQETQGSSFTSDYNRVAGANVNFSSTDNKWTALANYGKSFSDGESGLNDLFASRVSYNTREAQISLSGRTVGRNYMTDVGFNPRIYNYNANDGTVNRQGYRNLSGSVQLFNYLEDHKSIRSHRYVFFDTDHFWDEFGNNTYSNYFLNNAIWFHSTSAMYVNLFHERDKLQWAFDPIGSGLPLQPGQYNNSSIRSGYFSKITGKVVYDLWSSYGSFYGGNKFSSGIQTSMKMLPIAKIDAGYFIDRVDLKENGKRTLHLANLQKEIYLNNKLNWTTYVQYSTQADNVNFNTRWQWEYKPLSYVYLVVTDNLTENLNQKNWGVAVKANYRLDL